MHVSLLHADIVIANIYWDLGANVTQIGNPEAIANLVVLQFKVLPLLHNGILLFANASTGSTRRANYLGSFSQYVVSESIFSSSGSENEN